MTRKVTTPQDHRLWGDNLSMIRNGLVAISCDITQATSKTDVMNITTRLDKATELIDKARSDLEEIMFVDNKDAIGAMSDQDAFSFYYGDAKTQIYAIVHAHGETRRR